MNTFLDFFSINETVRPTLQKLQQCLLNSIKTLMSRLNQFIIVMIRWTNNVPDHIMSKASEKDVKKISVLSSHNFFSIKLCRFLKSFPFFRNNFYLKFNLVTRNTRNLKCQICARHCLEFCKQTFTLQC